MSTPIISGTQAYTGNELGGFETVGQQANLATNPAPWHLINGTVSATGSDAYARAPFGGYFQGLVVYVGENDHIAGDHEVNFYKVTEASNYTVREKISALTIVIPPLQTGYFWSNPDVSRGLRFFRKQDAIGVEVQKVGGATPTGISDITVTAVYDFEEGI